MVSATELGPSELLPGWGPCPTTGTRGCSLSSDTHAQSCTCPSTRTQLHPCPTTCTSMRTGPLHISGTQELFIVPLQEHTGRFPSPPRDTLEGWGLAPCLALQGGAKPGRRGLGDGPPTPRGTHSDEAFSRGISLGDAQLELEWRSSAQSD